MVIDKYVDPYTKHTLDKDAKGNLYCRQEKQDIAYVSYNGSYDFVRSKNNCAKEKEHYNRKYKHSIPEKKLGLKDICEQWYDKSLPHNLILLNSLGDLSGKRILLLGNGTSSKELYFLHQGANIVYTDISIDAALFMKNLFSYSELRESGYVNIEFHAVDALHLPFPDASFDIIYGYAFVHHIEDLDQLFSEVSRCLKQDGICRFFDDADSPIWQLMKNTLLRPLQLYSHRKTGISPADLRATQKGGYRKDEIIQLRQKFGFKKSIYKRVSFFNRLFNRGIMKLLGGNDYLIRKGTPIVLCIDNYLAQKSSLMRRNLIYLVWGFDK